MDLRDKKDLIDLVVRYLLIVVLGLGDLFIFYYLFGPLTIKAVISIVSLYSHVLVMQNDIVVNGVLFTFVGACIGGSAYYLLFILALSTRNVRVIDRVKAVLLSFFFLYIFNVFRIVFMIAISKQLYFDFVHWFLWYFIATAFVILDWFFISWIFGIRSVPIYSDVRYLVCSLKDKKKARKKARQKKGKK